MLRPCFYVLWNPRIAVIVPTIVVGADLDTGHLCAEFMWLGLVIGVGTTEADE